MDVHRVDLVKALSSSYDNGYARGQKDFLDALTEEIERIKQGCNSEGLPVDEKCIVASKVLILNDIISVANKIYKVKETEINGVV